MTRPRLHLQVFSPLVAGRGAQAWWTLLGGVMVLGGALVCAPEGRGAPAPAGTTAAVLSFIDASAGRVEIARHWPGATSDVDVSPFIPYFWNSCPGPGAIMMLVTNPAGGQPLPERIAGALEGRITDPGPSRTEIMRIIRALRTPGDPTEEALKASTPWVSDLATYERRGYAVFLFIHWQGIWCGVSVHVVPEGYGIPFVQ
jgi:hypothetical protein